MHQLRIMLDTNILISLIIFGGQVQNVFVELINMRHRMFVSTYIDHEFRDKVLEKWNDKKDIILSTYESLYIPVLESHYNDVIKTRDVKDNPVISDAISNGMDILLTGDKDLLELKEKLPVKIMSVNDVKNYLRII